MRFRIVLAALTIFGTAVSSMPAPVLAAFSPARAIAAPGPEIVYVQSGSTKVRKECEAKADKQKLRGLSHQAYVEQCMAALSFDNRYGVMQSK